MRKLFTCFLLLSVFAVKAQTLTVSTNTVQYNGAVGLGEYDTLYSVHNNTNAKVYVRWMRGLANAPAGWSTQICDKNNCYGSTIFTDTFSMLPNETSQMQVHLMASTKGTGQVILKLSNTTDTTTATTIVSYTLVNTGVSNVASANTVVAYNASNKSIIIKGYSSDIQYAEVYNLLGQKVMKTPLYNYSAIDINISTVNVGELTSGVYFVRLYDTHNQTIVTKKFIKQ